MRENVTLLIAGLGFSGFAVARLAAMRGIEVIGSSRNYDKRKVPPNVEWASFDDPAPYARATHLLASAPPGGDGDPVLSVHGASIRSGNLRWIGYLSTTGVYGDRAGKWVDEATETRPGQERSRRRVLAEQQWNAIADRRPLDVFRTAGIYGPGRSPFDELRAGRARSVRRPHHAFGRIHRDDIARAVLSAMARLGARRRILHLVDDEPAEPRDVTLEAARLLGMEPPPDIPFEQAWQGMSEMGRSFWSENRRVSNRMTKAELCLEWAYPSFREGLRAILAEERTQGPAE